MRVIAGTHRGRKLKAPRGMSTRPTTDRVREALFSILGGRVHESHVVDCFAGSGALGIEALSRGAAHATFIEADRAAAQCIQRNLDALGFSHSATVLCMRVERARSALLQRSPYQLVLADPPWPICQQAAVDLAECVRGLLASHAIAVLGHPAAQELILPERAGLASFDRRRWGGSGLTFYQQLPSDCSGNERA